MATRPIFVPKWTGSRLVEELAIEFPWHPGMAPSQKKKNVVELHAAARKRGFSNILEVSSKSETPLGARLSAFSLKIRLPTSDAEVPLESAYQGSKVFVRGGPFTDLYGVSPREAKADDRLRSSGALSGFHFAGESWHLEPKTAFYDWLYLYSLKDHADYLRRLFEYDAFSDIEFNPEKSINCQARSCAILVSLLKKDLYPRVVLDRELFISVIWPDSFSQPHSQDLRQGSLL